MAHPRTAVVLLLAFAFTTTGCLGLFKGDEPVDTAALPEENESLAPTTALPDGRGTCSGCAETNKTEEGVGGVDHKHDYWKGRDRVDLLKEALVYFGPTPVYPDGEGSAAKSVAYVKLPCTPLAQSSEDCDPGDRALVYEGAEKVLVTISAPTLGAFSQDGKPVGPAHPAPPKMSLQYRSSADADWRDPLPVTYGTPVDINVLPKETDMPHSERSLWVFRLTTDQTTSMYVTFSVVVQRGREVVNWPGHPDFYADVDSRIVLQKHVSTKMGGVVGGTLYDQGGTWVNPEKLISQGTGKIIVYANVTTIKSQTGQTATGYFLEHHNATVIGPEIRFGQRWSDRDNTNDLKSYDFEIEVSPDGMDSPYQPSSRWGFRLMATFADIDSPVEPPPGVPRGVGLCPGCFDYEIEYDITIIAVKADESQG